MDNQGSARMWDYDSATSQEPPPLRRPNIGPNVANNPQFYANLPQQLNNQLHISYQEQNTNTQNFLNRVRVSTLSAEAKEWYPPNFRYPIQQRLTRFRNQPSPPEYFANQPSPPEYFANQVTQDADIDTARLKEIINSLTYDPGKFDDLLETILDILTPYFDDISMTTNITKMIFDQALSQSNFTYNGARLCSIIQEHCPIFRSQLYISCEQELHKERSNPGLILFLAELYTQLNYEELYAHSLIEALKKLLLQATPVNIKCVCQTLKLTGFNLDVRNSKAVDEIFAEMLSKQNSLPSNIVTLLKYVEELRSKEWGHLSPQPSSSNGSATQNGFTSHESDNDIYYNEDGQEMTAEEREFLANCEEYNDYLSGNFDPDELCDPEPEMDEEIQAAFKEFVQLSKR